MKQFLLIAGMLCLSVLTRAQTPEEIVITASNKVVARSTPQQVIDSLKRRFPNAKSVQYYKTPPAALKAGWQVEETDNLTEDADIDSYTISFKRDDFQYYALFDENGNLLMSRFEEYSSKLPDAVKASLRSLAADKYKNYTFKSGKHYRQTNHKHSKNYYEVSAMSKTNPKEKRKLVFSPDGALIKER